MASSHERRGSVQHLDISRPRVVDALSHVPSLQEALRPGYMRDVLVPLAGPEIIWKLDHSVRVALAAGEMHEYLGSPRAIRLANIRAGLAHDALGAATTHHKGRLITAEQKIAILNKPGLLTAEEWEINQLHPTDAAKYLSGHFELLAAKLSLHHHTFQGERSYPFQTDPDAIDDKVLLRDLALFAAIDTTDALLTPRPYPKWEIVDGVRVLKSDSSKAGWDPERVLEELRAKFGTIVGEEDIAHVVKIGQRHAGRTGASYTQAAA